MLAVNTISYNVCAYQIKTRYASLLKQVKFVSDYICVAKENFNQEKYLIT